MGFDASDIVPFTQARANLSELAEQVKAGAIAVLQKRRAATSKWGDLAFLEARSAIARMIPSRLISALTSAPAEAPAVALPGPRQVGKTTLALELANTRPAVYLDLESSGN